MNKFSTPPRDCKRELLSPLNCSHVEKPCPSSGAEGLSKLAHCDNWESSGHGVHPLIGVLGQVKHNRRPVIQEAIVEELK